MRLASIKEVMQLGLVVCTAHLSPAHSGTARKGTRDLKQTVRPCIHQLRFATGLLTLDRFCR